MISLKDTAIAIEHVSYILTLIKEYCITNEYIQEVMTLKHAINDILKYVDHVYVKLLDEEII